MGSEAIQAVVGIVTAIIGLAILSVLVSTKANTAGVITASGSALASDINAAVSPITGGSGLSVPTVQPTTVVS
jgi:uncharacterized membrane protein (Fun14 family)